MENKAIKTIFIGTPDFGLPALEALHESSDFEIIGVITQPDKKVGRKQELTKSPIKVFAEDNNIKIWQPEKISNFQFPISNFDIAIVIAYAQIIPKNILDLPKYGCINVHGSLLPKYRGAACVQAPILNGDKESGITIMKMDEGLDTGPIIEKFSIEISDSDTGGSLYEKLSKLAGQKICTSLLQYVKGEISPTPQDNSQSSYVGLIKKTDGKINWQKKAEEIEKQIRAMQPWPKAYSFLPDKKKLIIHSVENSPLKIRKAEPGLIKTIDNKLIISASDKALIINELQIEGKNKTLSSDFLKGNSKYLNIILK